MITHTMINAGLRTGWPESMVSVQPVVGGQWPGVRGGNPKCGKVGDDSFLHAVDRARMVGTSGRERPPWPLRECVPHTGRAHVGVALKPGSRPSEGPGRCDGGCGWWPVRLLPPPWLDARLHLMRVSYRCGRCLRRH